MTSNHDIEDHKPVGLVEEKLVPIIAQVIDSYGLAGLGVGIVKDGAVVLARGFGQRFQKPEGRVKQIIIQGDRNYTRRIGRNRFGRSTIYPVNPQQNVSQPAQVDSNAGGQKGLTVMNLPLPTGS